MDKKEPAENIRLVHVDCSSRRKAEFQEYVDQLLVSDKLQKEFAAKMFAGKMYFKAGVSDGSIIENMWFRVQSADFVDGDFTGILDNDPVVVTSYVLGEQYCLPLNSVLEMFE